MTVKEFFQAIGVKLEVNRRDSDGSYSVRGASTEVMVRPGILCAEYGDGKNPQEAINNYGRNITGKRIVVDAWKDTRREVEVPKSFDVVPVSLDYVAEKLCEAEQHVCTAYSNSYVCTSEQYAAQSATLTVRDDELAKLRERCTELDAEAEKYSMELGIALRDQFELAQLRERCAALELSLKEANYLILEWSNFDFDCPDEYNEEKDWEEEDGWALDQLYQKTGAHLKNYFGS